MWTRGRGHVKTEAEVEGMQPGAQEPKRQAAPSREPWGHSPDFSSGPAGGAQVPVGLTSLSIGAAAPGNGPPAFARFGQRAQELGIQPSQPGCVSGFEDSHTGFRGRVKTLRLGLETGFGACVLLLTRWAKCLPA